MSNSSYNAQNTNNMSAYTDSIQAYANGKSYQTAGSASSAHAPAAAPAAAAAPASTYASSTYSDASYYKDSAAAAPKKSSSMTNSIKSWTKELISDMGKPPTSRYDAAQAASSSSSPASYGTNPIGAPYWSDNRPGKM